MPAQVDSFLPFESLMARPRPQDFGRRAAKTPPQVVWMVPATILDLDSLLYRS